MLTNALLTLYEVQESTGACTFLVKAPAADSISSTSRSVNSPVFHPSQAVAHSSETVQIYTTSTRNGFFKHGNSISRTPGGHELQDIEIRMSDEMRSTLSPWLVSIRWLVAGSAYLVSAM